MGKRNIDKVDAVEILFHLVTQSFGSRFVDLNRTGGVLLPVSRNYFNRNRRGEGGRVVWQDLAWRLTTRL